MVTKTILESSHRLISATHKIGCDKSYRISNSWSLGCLDGSMSQTCYKGICEQASECIIKGMVYVFTLLHCHWIVTMKSDTTCWGFAWLFIIFLPGFWWNSTWFTRWGAFQFLLAQVSSTTALKKSITHEWIKSKAHVHKSNQRCQILMSLSANLFTLFILARPGEKKNINLWNEIDEPLKLGQLAKKVHFALGVQGVLHNSTRGNTIGQDHNNQQSNAKDHKTFSLILLCVWWTLLHVINV